MNNITQYLPEDIEMDEKKGFVKRKGEKETVLANAIPIVNKRTKHINHITNKTQDLITISYLTHNNTRIGTERDFTEEEIMSGKFMKALPIEVQIENARIGPIFRKIIQNQICTIPIETKEIYDFGWYKKHFHWGEDELQNISASQEYRAALRVGSILSANNSVSIALLLAMVHGPMGGVFHSSGIQHDFVTFISGPTSIGKTALAKKFCGYLKHRPCILALSSDRKEMRKTLQNSTDITMIVDDFNTSSSNRVISRQLQIVSEIIQTACDAGDLILDETSLEKRHNSVHIVITSETTVRNISTMNRCFWVDMQESVSPDLWNKISAMEEGNIFSIFIQSYVKYVEENYDTIAAKCREEFSCYKQYAIEKILFSSISRNRIAETLAVQYTLKQQFINYLKSVGINDSLCKRLDKSMERCISSSGQELQKMIDDIHVKKSHMELLPTLAEIVSSLDGYYGYKLAKNETKYRNEIKKGNLKYLGFQANRGYISFSPSHMCRLIADRLEKENISVNCLGKELSYYHLAHVEHSEQKQSCSWHTKEKYFHVHYRELIELYYSTKFPGIEFLKESCEKIISDFDNYYQKYSY